MARTFPARPAPPWGGPTTECSMPAASRSSSVCAKSRAETRTSWPRSSSSPISGRKNGTCGEFVMSIQTFICRPYRVARSPSARAAPEPTHYRSRPNRDPEIRFPYGYPSARRVLRRRRAAQLLAGGRAARRHPACRLAAGAVAREAARDAAPRPLRAPGRADRGRAAAVPQRATAAPTRGADARRGLGRERRRPHRRALDRCLHGPGCGRRSASSSASSSSSIPTSGSRSRCTTRRPSSISSPTASSSSASSARLGVTGRSGSSRSSRTR